MLLQNVKYVVNSQKMTFIKVSHHGGIRCPYTRSWGTLTDFGTYHGVGYVYEELNTTLIQDYFGSI